MCFLDYHLPDYTLLIGLTVLCGLLYWYQTKTFSHWKNLGVPYIEPNFLFGNIKESVLQRETWTVFSMKIYDAFKHHGFGGVFLFRNPAIVICDPELIEKVLVQDFDHFHDRWVDSIDEPMLQSLFHTSGERWRAMRLKIGSAFSSQKVRCMFGQLLKSSECALTEIKASVTENRSLEVGPVGSTFATDVIASCAFGLQFQSDSVEGKQFRHIMDIVFTNTPWKVLTYMYKMFHPTIVKWLNLKFMVNEVETYFLTLCRNTIKYRTQNGIQRCDLLHLMMSLKNDNVKCQKSDDSEMMEEGGERVPLEYTPTGEQVFSEETIASMMFNFLLAGIKSTESTVSFALFEIARNPKIQKTLRKEVNAMTSKFKGWTYEAVRDMTYLDQVIQETLRMYTYNANVTRVVTRPYRIPNTNVVLEQGFQVIVPAAAIHMDPQHYPSPEVFDPDRFEGNNYKSSACFLPFGAGPRICVSIRLAVTMMKVYLAKILETYSLRFDSGKTQFPIQFDPARFFPEAKGGMWIEFKEIQS